ncbi:MAG TPA: alpha/beta hydrolase [Gemmatimonadales bacterium]|nr:alpha/beta hydrolase [Gemmatimonadales bacterium]
MSPALRTRSRDGTAIAYERRGEGPPLIVVSGALCSRAFGAQPKLTELLARRFTVYDWDRRGRNESGDTAPYAVARELEDLAALIGEAGGSAHLLGFSSGAALALEAAAAGLPVRKLALYEPPYVGRRNGGPEPDHRGRLEALLGAGRRGAAVRYFMADMVGMPRIVAWAMRLFPMWPKLEAVAHTLPYDAAIMGDWEVPAARAAAVKVPTLVLGGGKSPAALRSAVDRTAAAIPGATRRVLEGQSHQAAPDTLAPVLTEFLA